MANSSILGGEQAARRSKGRDADKLGPSDSSDSGSDIQGERRMATGADKPDELGGLPVNPHSDSDAYGTGERGSATGNDVASGADILPDRIAIDPAFADEMLTAPNLADDNDIDVEELADSIADEGDDNAEEQDESA